ncbi:MAG TPA: amino acid adenylation domain-containing protein, partial [Ktedonobacteraceae bacterium]
PRTSEEEILAHIWERVLQVEQVGIHDNFFALGGDSIRSIQVLALARERHLAYSPMQLFQYQTVASLAQALFNETTHAEVFVTSQPFLLLTQEDRARMLEDIEDAYPLTMLQAGMFFHSEYSPESAVYQNVSSYHLQARFDLVSLQSAAQQVLTRHPILRTSFDLESYSQPLQLVHRQVEVPLLYEDLRHLAPAEQDASIADLLEREKAHRFVWEHAPLWRLQVHRRGEQTFQVTLTEHHAILDGWSVASLFTELLERYLLLLDNAGAAGASPLAALFRDFVLMEQAALTSTEAAAFWTHYLRDSVRLALPRRTGARQTDLQASQLLMTVAIPAHVSQGLHQLARAAAVPLKSVLLASHLNVLRVLSGQTDVLTGLVTNGRPEMTDGEQVLGLFLNTLPYRARLGGGSWLDLVRGVFEGERAILPWRRYPLARIQHEQGGPALFETIFNYNHFHVYERLGEVSHLRVLGAESFAQTNFTLVVHFSQALTSGQVRLQLECNDGQISSEQLDAIGGYYVRTLSAMAVSPTARYELCSLLSEREQQLLLHAWNATGKAANIERCLHELFEEQVARTPDALALSWEEEHLSYQELNSRANCLARALVEQGVKPESRVGLCLERSLDLVIGLLAILKAGGAYVPLDPAYPAERLAFLLTNARITALLTHSRLRERLPSHHARVLDVDAGPPPTPDPLASSNLASGVRPENLAYVIYTSGSTGTPKGVMVTHANVTRLFEATRSACHFGPRDGWTLFHSSAFDFSVWELWGALLSGARLLIVTYWQSRTPSAFAELLEQEQVTVLNQTPSAFASLRAELASRRVSALRLVIFGGEALDARSVLGWWEQRGEGGPQMVNMYGITETTVHVTWQSLTPELLAQRGGSVIGQPLADLRVYVLDGHLQLVPPGVAGQLWVAGAGLARGYLGQPALTAERFRPHPWSDQPGERLYQTGDVVRWRADGRLEYLGRSDSQVKVRGYRVEPGEIEAALRSHPEVQESVVQVLRDEGSAQGRLVAYVVLHPGRIVTVSVLRRHLQARLPDYLVPASILVLEGWPVLPNGKLDRARLPVPGPARPELGEAYVAPRTSEEEILAHIWERVLQVEQVGIHDNFFALGGDSIRSIQVLALAR